MFKTFCDLGFPVVEADLLGAPIVVQISFFLATACQSRDIEHMR